jgi:hypothetical protein
MLQRCYGLFYQRPEEHVVNTRRNLQRFRGPIRISLFILAFAILYRFGLRFDFAPIALAVSSSGTPLSEPAAEHGSQAVGRL